jgi:L-lactate dehydrogenase complex protein LldG
MSSHDAILRAVRRNQPPTRPLPTVPAFEFGRSDLASAFTEALGRSGGTVLKATTTVGDVVTERFPDATVIASTEPDLAQQTIALQAVDNPHDLANLDVLVCRGVVGVAENGAVWLPESRLCHRAALFIAQHLVVALDGGALVGTMHEAYARLDVAEEGFGVFVAGPSKTADIEQSLVIGAHGPRSFTVVLV